MLIPHKWGEIGPKKWPYKLVTVCVVFLLEMGVSKNRGKTLLKMDDLGVFPYFWKHPNGVMTLLLTGNW